jgi:hypothetical protein
LVASRRDVDRDRATVEDEADACPRVDPDGRRRSVNGLQRALRAAFSYAARGSQKPGEFAMFVI